MLRSLQDGAPPLVLGGPGLLPTDIEILPELQALYMRAVVELIASLIVHFLRCRSSQSPVEWPCDDRGHSSCLRMDAKSYPSTSPHYSRALLLQSWIRRCDTLGRMFHSAQAGGLAARSVNILFKDASLPRGSARPSRWATPRFREEPS